jgi:hypothetical protein
MFFYHIGGWIEKHSSPIDSSSSASSICQLLVPPFFYPTAHVLQFIRSNQWSLILYMSCLIYRLECESSANN